MSLIRNRLAASFAVLAVTALTLGGVARAGEEVAPKAPIADAAKPAAGAEAPTTAVAPATKTPSPMHSLMGWVAKQVAPSLECPCPATADGETAWRGWFTGGANVPLAALRDRMVADGWTADRFVTFFQEMKKSGDCSKGDCAKGDCTKADGTKGACAKCAKGECADCAKCAKGECADCTKPCCSGCKKDAAKADGTAAPAKPTETPSKP